METVREVCKYIGSIIDSKPVCIETGCMHYTPDYNLIHTTTNNIAKYVCKDNGGMLYSLDMDVDHIDSAIDLLTSEEAQDHCSFVYGDSVESIKNLRESWKGEQVVDLLCLDALGDPGHTAQEYTEIKSCLKDKHFVLVDDIHNPNSIKYKRIVPMLKELNYKYKEIHTPTGLFLSSMGYDL